MLPWWATSKTDVHFNYNLSGGSMMAMGTYNFAALRLIFGADPVECVSCDTKAYTDGIHANCDHEFMARFAFPNGGTWEASCTLNGGTWFTFSTAVVTLWEIEIPDDTLPASQEKFR